MEPVYSAWVYEGSVVNSPVLYPELEYSLFCGFLLAADRVPPGTCKNETHTLCKKCCCLRIPNLGFIDAKRMQETANLVEVYIITLTGRRLLVRYSDTLS